MAHLPEDLKEGRVGDICRRGGTDVRNNNEEPLDVLAMTGLTRSLILPNGSNLKNPHGQCAFNGSVNLIGSSVGMQRSLSRSDLLHPPGVAVCVDFRELFGEMWRENQAKTVDLRNALVVLPQSSTDQRTGMASIWIDAARPTVVGKPVSDANGSVMSMEWVRDP